jgi:hypothetical protein
VAERRAGKAHGPLLGQANLQIVMDDPSGLAYDEMAVITPCVNDPCRRRSGWRGIPTTCLGRYTTGTHHGRKRSISANIALRSIPCAHTTFSRDHAVSTVG